MSTGTGPLQTDLKKFYLIHFGDDSPPLARKLELWLAHHGLHCVAVYRFGRFAQTFAAKHRVLGVPLKQVRRLLNTMMGFFHHVDINAKIGPGLYIGHVGNIHIGDTEIGQNFSITHNVTIGYGHNGSGEKIPTIGDDVWIGTSSVLSGAIKVGNGVTIANGTMLSRTVPDDCLVGGNPAKLILRDYDNASLLRLAKRTRPAASKPQQPEPTGQGCVPSATKEA